MANGDEFPRFEATAHSAIQDPSATDVSSPTAQHRRAGIARLSVVLPVAGPLVCHARSAPGSYPRRQAAIAFNEQLTFLAWLAITGSPLALLLVSPNPGTDPRHLLLATPTALVIAMGVIATLSGARDAFLGVDRSRHRRRFLKVTVLPEGQHDLWRARLHRPLLSWGRHG